MTDPPPEAGTNSDSPEPTPPDETGDSAEPEPASRRRSRRTFAIIAAALALVLVAAGLLGARVLGVWGPDSEPLAEPTPTPSPTQSAAPSPFDGTPAENFAEGADGIVLPEAEAVGDFTADQVAEALEQVRDALIAARLDRSMLIDHDPEPFLAVLADDLQPALSEVIDSADFAAFASQVDEDAVLASLSPRVAGSISYRTTTAGAQETEVIEMNTRFTWVYPFEATDPEAGGDLVVVRDELVWRMQFGEPWLETSRGLWLVGETSRAWGADCETLAEGMLLPDRESATSLAERADEIFDPEQPLETVETC
jgi:hypothetical protein